MAFAQSLIDGVRRNRAEIDVLLAKTADHWSLERMAATDRNVLRLGAYEILYTQTPGAVAINEAVELAKRFGAAQSAQFVNGILDKFIEGHGKQMTSDEIRMTNERTRATILVPTLCVGTQCFDALRRE